MYSGTVVSLKLQLKVPVNKIQNSFIKPHHLSSSVDLSETVHVHGNVLGTRCGQLDINDFQFFTCLKYLDYSINACLIEKKTTVHCNILLYFTTSRQAMSQPEAASGPPTNSRREDFEIHTRVTGCLRSIQHLMLTKLNHCFFPSDPQQVKHSFEH